MAYEDRFGDSADEDNDLLHMPIDELAELARGIRGELVSEEINPDVLRAMADTYGGLGEEWDAYLYESRSDWRKREADLSAAQNAPQLADLAGQLGKYDAAVGCELLPLPVLILNISGHSWSIYDHLNHPGDPKLHDDGHHGGIHALTQNWRELLPADENSWYTDQFVATCAELAQASYNTRLASGDLTRSEWQQKGSRTLVMAVRLANNRQRYGWAQFMDGLNPPMARSRYGRQADMPSPVLVEEIHPFMVGEFDETTEIELWTIPVNPRIAEETGVKTLKIYVIRPEE